MDHQLVAGIASFGMSGRIFHMPLLTSHEAFRVEGVVERTTDEARKRYQGVTVFRSFDEMLSNREIELVVVNTPDPTHFALTKRALEAGKHVVVEKPFMQTVEQCEEVLAIARSAGKQVCVFHNRRWDGDFLTVQKLLREERLGRVVDYEAHWDRYRNAIQPDSWKEQSSAGAGLLYNLGSHLIDQALLLFGMPQAVTADVRTVRPSGDVDDWFHVRLHYPHVQVSLKSSYLVREPGPRYLVHGELGSFVKFGIDPQEQALAEGANPTSSRWGEDPEEYWGVLHTETEGRIVRQNLRTERGTYRAFYDSVYDCIRRGTACAVRPEEAVNVIRVITAARRSSQEQRTLPVPRDSPRN